MEVFLDLFSQGLHALGNLLAAYLLWAAITCEQADVSPPVRALMMFGLIFGPILILLVLPSFGSRRFRL